MSSEAARPGEPAIRVDNVSKHYVMFERPEDRFKQMVVPRLQRVIGRPPKRYYRDFAALNGVSLEVGRGETVGVIGRNGSGKSTLLQIICGTLQPTSGSVEVNGRIAALLELGAGFNPEFTGRENVFLNGQILGVPRQEMEWRFDDIARFADIGPFIDEPVKTYSSGMYVRLAFATAINVDPDILVVDEALAVGDEAFQRKCFARIEDIKDKGGTILFVSHGAQAIVQLCTRAVLIDAGEKILEGRPKAVVSQYQRLVNLTGERAAAVREEIRSSPVESLAASAEASAQGGDAAAMEAEDSGEAVEDMSWFDPTLVSHSRVEYERQGATISDVRMTTLDGRQVNLLEAGRSYIYSYRVEFAETLRQVGFGMSIKNSLGLELAGGTTSLVSKLQIPMVEAGDAVDVRFKWECRLNPGAYFTNAGTSAEMADGRKHSHRVLDAIAFKVLPVEGQVAAGWVDLIEDIKLTNLPRTSVGHES